MLQFILASTSHLAPPHLLYMPHTVSEPTQPQLYATPPAALRDQATLETNHDHPSRIIITCTPVNMCNRCKWHGTRTTGNSPMPWSQYPDLSPCNWLLQTDYAHMALAAGPLDVPLGPLQALSTFLPNDNSPLAAETESILKNLRGIQEQVRLN